MKFQGHFGKLTSMLNPRPDTDYNVIYIYIYEHVLFKKKKIITLISKGKVRCGSL